MIHCIGDSHVYIFTGTDVIGGNVFPGTSVIGGDDALPFFKTYLLGSHTAYNVIKRRSLIEQIIVKVVRPDDMIMFCFGEIDCRAHLLKQAELQKIPLASIVSECVDRYFEIFRIAKQYGVPLLAWNVPPSSREDIVCEEYSTYGSCRERNMATELFNNSLQKHCEESGVIYVSIFDKLIGKDGLTDTSYFLDPIHLSQKAMPLILEELRHKGVALKTAHSASDMHQDSTDGKRVASSKDKILIYCGINNLLNFNRLRPDYDVCYGFDANPAKIEHAKQLYKNDPNAHFIFGALAERSGEEIEFHITNEWDPSSTIGELNPEYVHMRSGKLTSQTKIKVPTINLYDFCVSNHIQEIHTLLTDLQGMDLTVLKTMNEFIRNRKITEIQCETETDNTPSIHLNLPTNKLKDFKILLSADYDFVWQHPEVVPDDWWEMDTRWRVKQPRAVKQNRVAINIVYEHFQKETTASLHRGGASVVWSAVPLKGFDVYAYLNASSFRGKQSGIDVLIMLEPIVVLPGEYNEDVWMHFDHIFSLCDALSKYGNKFTKIAFPRSGWTSAWVKQSSITEDIAERNKLYPLKNRMNSVCMINGYKRSFVQSELYSKRNDIAEWFYENSDIPFDIFGNPPFPLPNYKGALAPDTKLDALCRYKYCLCFENTNHEIFSAGYITEKILDCFEARTIPIYLGSVNIEKYIPPECFIDFRQFTDPADLNRFLHSVSDEEYQRYIDHIDAWVARGGLRSYSWQAIYNQLADVYAAETDSNSNDIFMLESNWSGGISTSSDIRDFSPVISSPLWTWRDLADGSSQLLTDAEGSGEALRNDYILHFQNIKSEHGSLRTEFLREISDVFGLDTFIETGTYLGDTSHAASKIFQSVHTIELSAELSQKAMERFKNNTHIHVYNGDSGKIFPELLRRIKGKPLFWLDGHYSEGVTAKGDENTPIIKEIMAIKDAQITDAVILIDDLRFFDTVWDIIPEHSSARGYPSIVSLCGAIREIDSAYQFAVVGDVFMAYPASAVFDVTPVVAACTASRLYDGTNFTLEQVLKAEAVIGSAQAAELFALQNLFGACSSVESHGLAKHYRLWHALILAFHQDYMKACKEFLMAMNLGFDHWRINWYLAKAAYQAKYFSLAKREVEIVLMTAPDYREARQLLDQIEMSRENGAKENVFSSEERIELAQHYQRAAKYDKAINEWEAGIRCDPNNPDIRHGYARLYVATRQYEKAITELQNALNLNSTYAPAHNDLGEIYAMMGDSKKALEHFRRVVSIDSKQYNALANSLNILIKDSDFEEAANILKPLLEASPNDLNLLKFAEQFIALAKKEGKMPDMHDGTADSVQHEHLAAEKGSDLQRVRQNVQIMSGTQISADCQIGDYSYIGHNCFITKSTIGRYCSIANNVSIGQGEHDFNRISTSSIFYEYPYQELTRKACMIGNDVWIGVDAIIKRGVVIGDGAVIGANSFVNTDIPAYAVAAGSPAKILKFRFSPGKIAEIRKSSWWNYDLNDAKNIIRALEDHTQKEATATNRSLAHNGNSHILTIVFSKDRAMQLDCTLRSLRSHCKDIDAQSLKVLYTTSTALHENQYHTIQAEYPSVEFIREKDFRSDLISLLTSPDYILFLVDDNIFIRDFVLDHAVNALSNNPGCIGFSLRLGRNTDYCYMLGKPQRMPSFIPLGDGIFRYEWTTAECDFGYPLELSSSLYRTADILPLLNTLDYKNPNTLEFALESNKGLLQTAKNDLLCFEKSMTFCNPINMVQTSWKNRAGERSSYSPEKMAEMYDQGYRIDPECFSEFTPVSCHQEEDLSFVRRGGTLREDPIVSIVILHQNGLNHIRLNIESIRRNTPEPHEIIVFDNASTDESREYLRSLTDIVLIESPQNIGCTPARARAMSIARGQYLILLDNDTIVTKGWSTRFIDHAEKNPHIGMMGPCSNYASGPQLVPDVPYTDISGLDTFAAQFFAEHRGQLSPTHRLVGFCMFIRKELFEKIGIIDESLGFFGFDDDDYTLRAYIAGFNPSIARDIFIHHTGGPQGRGDQQVNRALLDAWECFKKKWGISQGIAYGKPYDIAPILAQRFDKQKHFCQPFPRSVMDEMIYRDKSSADHDTRTTGMTPSLLHPESVKGITSIMIPVRSVHLVECVSSIQEFTDTPHEVIFLDQGAAPKVKKQIMKAVKDNHNYKVAKIDRKANFAQSLNEGINQSTGEYIVLLFDDVIVGESWLSDMLECQHSGKNIGVVGAMSDNASSLQRVAGIDFKSPGERVSFRERNRHRRIPTRNLDGFCMLFRRDLLTRIGLFDEMFGGDIHVFDDLCVRAVLEGFNNVIAGSVFVHNGGGVNRLLSRDKTLFDEKWIGLDASTPLAERVLTANALEMARSQYHKGLVDDAINTLILRIGFSPGETRLFYRLSEILLAEHRFQDALDALKGISAAEEDTEYSVLMGYANEGLGVYQAAEEHVDKALTVDGSSAPALNLKGILAYRKSDMSKAEEWFRSAIEADPGYGDPYANIGMLRWKTDHVEEAVDLFEKSFILSSDQGDLITGYYQAVSSLERYGRADIVFREARAAYSENKRILFLLIDVLLKQDKFQEAMKEVEKAMVHFGMDEGILSAALAIREKIGAKSIPAKDGRAKSAPTLSVCMIVKNEERHLAYCLNSLSPVADEMIVVDTGSTDKTKQIAEAFGAQVFDFEWINDFAAARNHSLSKAQGDWILVMDADEVISFEDHEKVRKLITRKGDVAYNIITRNYVDRTAGDRWTCNDNTYIHEQAGRGWFPSGKVRLFPNHEKIRFENPIHELVEYSLQRMGFTRLESGIPVHHYGELDAEKATVKDAQYYELGVKKMKDSGGDFRSVWELAVQAGELGKIEESIELWHKVLEFKQREAAAYFNLANHYMHLKKYEDSYACSRKAYALDPRDQSSVLSYAMSEFLAGDIHKTRSTLEGFLNGTDSQTSHVALLAVSYLILGDKNRGLKSLRGLVKQKYNCVHYLKELSQSLLDAGNLARAKTLLTTAIEIKFYDQETSALLAKCDEVGTGKKRASMLT
jgi:FkbM family methyltransferase